MHRAWQPKLWLNLLEGLIEAYQPVAEEKRQNLQGRVMPGLFVHGDRELLTQLFANLIENAIGHSPAGAEFPSRRRQHGARWW
jgi:signal transduction histidine kinase